MDVKTTRPKLDPETCSICGRRLLQGENVNWYVAPDSSRRAVCELCIPRAERVRWVREREGEEIVQLRPTRNRSGGFMRRAMEFFGAGEPRDEDDFAIEADPAEAPERRSRRRERAAEPPVATPPRDIRAIPTEPEARLQQGIELFNISQFPRTIAGLTRSLGDPLVAAVNHEENFVDVFVGWDIAWYSYRVSLGDATGPVEQLGRGNDSAELVGVVTDWNAGADGFGHVYLKDGAGSDPAAGQDAPDEADRSR